jgi:hypothetical protein
MLAGPGLESYPSLSWTKKLQNEAPRAHFALSSEHSCGADENNDGQAKRNITQNEVKHND